MSRAAEDRGEPGQPQAGADEAAMPWERGSRPWGANPPFLGENNENAQFWWAKDILCLVQCSSEWERWSFFENTQGFLSESF